MLKLTAIVLLFSLAHQARLAPSLDSHLARSLKAKGRVNVILTLRERTSPLLAQLSRRNFATRAERLNTVVDGLRVFAAKSQGNILQVLGQESGNRMRGEDAFRYKSLWLTNQVLVWAADLDLIQKLSAFEEVDSITEEIVVNLEDPIDLSVHEELPAAEGEVQWGIARIEAPRVWEEGNRGGNIVVASIDTGVRVTHEALRDNFRGDYGWFDPPYKTQVPADGHGHGTHTMGSIAGTKRNIGVAPDSQWISCKGCTGSSCFQAHLLECAQWIACPTDPSGSNPDCSKAPHLVSNSWSGGRGSSWFTSSILAWRAAGIIPLFSIGNTGPTCGTAGSPGDDPNVIGVGATTFENVRSDFSSVGPAYLSNGIKPDIAAPGSNVFSAYHTADHAYASMSGTSMASPHASGTVALILSSANSADEYVDFDLIKESLQGGALPTVSEGKSCMGIPDSQFPNHHAGHGRINAHLAISAFKQLIKNRR